MDLVGRWLYLALDNGQEVHIGVLAQLNQKKSFCFFSAFESIKPSSSRIFLNPMNCTYYILDISRCHELCFPVIDDGLNRALYDCLLLGKCIVDIIFAYTLPNHAFIWPKSKLMSLFNPIFVANEPWDFSMAKDAMTDHENTTARSIFASNNAITPRRSPSTSRSPSISRSPSPRSRSFHRSRSRSNHRPSERQ